LKEDKFQKKNAGKKCFFPDTSAGKPPDFFDAPAPRWEDLTILTHQPSADAFDFFNDRAWVL